jgi:curved DNA-binding protein CbpA
MDKKLYEVLGVSENASLEEIKFAYQTLKNKYMEERFLEGEEGNIAAKKLTEVENAYREILSFKEQNGGKDAGSLFSEIESLIKNGDLYNAQAKLDLFDERSAEWHYYQSVIFFKKNWVNESKKQLEIAIQMDPYNDKYKNALNKLNERVNQTANPNWNRSGNAYNNPNAEQTRQFTNDTPQLGGDSCCQWCCDMLICNALLNCCCNCH